MNILISVGKTADPTNYIRAVENAGGTAHACYLPKPNPNFDGLILAGGGDICPSLFGQKNCGSTDIDPDRDRCEFALLDTFTRMGKPILGICRGHQVVNVWAGGGLIQDLGEQNAIHRREGQDKVHLVSASGVLKSLYGPMFRVNSAHHQGIGPVGKGLAVTARSADGVIEGLEHRSLPILTTQFHPERMTGAETPSGSLIFQWFTRNRFPN